MEREGSCNRIKRNLSVKGGSMAQKGMDFKHKEVINIKD